MTVCEIKERGLWRLIAVREAVNLSEKQIEEPCLRCIECHGRILIVLDGRGKGTAHCRHFKRHDGCSKAGNIFKGIAIRHPDALA